MLIRVVLSRQEILRFPTVRRSIRLALAAEFIPVLTYLVGGDGTGNLYVDGGGPELREGSPGRNNEHYQSRVDTVLTLARRARNDVDILGMEIIDGKGNLPEVEI